MDFWLFVGKRVSRVEELSFQSHGFLRSGISSEFRPLIATICPQNIDLKKKKKNPKTQPSPPRNDGTRAPRHLCQRRFPVRCKKCRTPNPVALPKWHSDGFSNPIIIPIPWNHPPPYSWGVATGNLNCQHSIRRRFGSAVGPPLSAWIIQPSPPQPLRRWNCPPEKGWRPIVWGIDKG